MHDAFGTGAAWASSSGRKRTRRRAGRAGVRVSARRGQNRSAGERPRGCPRKKTSAAGRSLIDAATRTNHANPDAAVSTRLIQANQASGGRGSGYARLVFGFRKGRLGDEHDKENDTNHRDRRGVVDCAHVDQRVIHSVLPARAFPGQAYRPPTWNVKLPCVVWVSTESTCQRTR
jgi:hypothetical protein